MIHRLCAPRLGLHGGGRRTIQPFGGGGPALCRLHGAGPERVGTGPGAVVCFEVGHIGCAERTPQHRAGAFDAGFMAVRPGLGGLAVDGPLAFPGQGRAVPFRDHLKRPDFLVSVIVRRVHGDRAGNGNAFGHPAVLFFHQGVEGVFPHLAYDLGGLPPAKEVLLLAFKGRLAFNEGGGALEGKGRLFEGLLGRPPSPLKIRTGICSHGYQGGC